MIKYEATTLKKERIKTILLERKWTQKFGVELQLSHGLTYNLNDLLPFERTIEQTTGTMPLARKTIVM